MEEFHWWYIPIIIVAWVLAVIINGKIWDKNYKDRYRK